MAFDAGAVEATLTIATAQASRDLDAIEARVKRFTDEKREIKVSAVFDDASLSKARQAFAQLDQTLSNDAMNRLRSSPQGSVLGSLNALFSPHQVTGAPSAQQSAQQGLLGQIVNSTGTSSGGSMPAPGGSAGNASTEDLIRQVLTGQSPSDTATTDTIRQVLAGQGASDVTTTDKILQQLAGTGASDVITTDKIIQQLAGTGAQDVTTVDKVEQVLTGDGPKDVTTTDTVKRVIEGEQPKDTETTDTVHEKLDEDAAKQTEDDSRSSGDRAGKGWGSAFTAAASAALAKFASSAGSSGGGGKNGKLLSGLFGGGSEESGSGEESALDKGLIGAIGPGILGTSFLKSSLLGLGAAGLGALPALAGSTLPLELAVPGAEIAEQGASALIGTKNTAGSAPTQGPLYQQAQAAEASLKSLLTDSASGLLAPLKSVFDQIPALAKQVEPGLKAVFSGTASLIQPVLVPLVSIVEKVGPELGDAFKAAGPLLSPLLSGIGNLVSGLLPGLITLLDDAQPAVKVLAGFFGDLGSSLGEMFSDFASVIGPSSTILEALLGIVSGLLPVIGSLAKGMAGALGPAFTAFGAAVQALEPFLVTVGSVLAQFAGAVLTDLSGGLTLVASVLKATAPAFDGLASSLGSVFTTLENSGALAQLGDILENLATPLGKLVSTLVSSLEPSIPPLVTLFGDLVNVVSTVGTQVLTALIPPLTQLAETALGAISRALPVVIPLVTQFVTAFTADAGTVITQVGTALVNLAEVALTKLLQAAQPLIPVVTDLLEAFTPLLNVLTPVVAGAIAGVADALAAVIGAIPPDAVAGVAVAVGGVVLAMKAWGAAATLVTGSLTDLFTSGFALWIGNAVTGVTEFTSGLEGASLAEKAFAAAEVAVDALNPFGWAVLGAAALGALVTAGIAATRGEADMISMLEQQNDATGYNITGYQNAAKAVEAYGAAQQKVASQPGIGIRGDGGVQSVASAAAAAASQLSQTAINMQARLTDLSGSFGVSETQIEKWASAAGISAQQFGGAGENVSKLTEQIVQYVDKNASAVTATASVSTNMAILGNDVFTATAQLDAFNAIWNTLVGSLLSKQEALTESDTQFQNLQQTIAQSGKSSTAAESSFEQYIQQIGASASTLEKNGTSISGINSYLQTQINHITSLGPLNKQQEADLQALTAFQNTLANSTKGLNDQQLTFIHQVEQNIIPDLVKMHADTPKVNTDISNLANSIAQTGTKSSSTAADRKQLIADLEAMHVNAQTATKFVDGLTSSLGKVPKSVSSTIGVKATGSGGLSLSSSGTLPGMSKTSAELSLSGLATGGMIPGGYGGGDKHLYALESGEIVVPKHLARDNIALFKAMGIPGLATGGIAGVAPWADSAADSTSGTDSLNWAKYIASQFESALTAAAAVSTSTSLLSPTGSGKTIQALMQSMAASVGWTGAEWTALNNVEMREAGYNLTAQNPTSSAYGLAQFIDGASEYALYGGNSTTAQGQITAMLNYIRQRYGDPIAAWQMEQTAGYYGNGGMITEPVIGYGVNSGRRFAFGESGHEQVTPVAEVMRNAAAQSAMGDSLNRIEVHLSRLADLTAAAPDRIGARVGGAIGGAAGDAAFRSRFNGRGW